MNTDYLCLADVEPVEIKTGHTITATSHKQQPFKTVCKLAKYLALHMNLLLNFGSVHAKLICKDTQ